MPSAHVFWFISSAGWLVDATIRMLDHRGAWWLWYAASFVTLILGTYSQRRLKR